jgi:hypothetical protein
VHTDDLAILVVGRAADFPKPLDTLGKVTNVDITIPKKPVMIVTASVSTRYIGR